jgi:hypothetical protein
MVQGPVQSGSQIAADRAPATMHFVAIHADGAANCHSKRVVAAARELAITIGGWQGIFSGES